MSHNYLNYLRLQLGMSLALPRWRRRSDAHPNPMDPIPCDDGRAGNSFRLRGRGNLLVRRRWRCGRLVRRRNRTSREDPELGRPGIVYRQYLIESGDGSGGFEIYVNESGSFADADTPNAIISA